MLAHTRNIYMLCYGSVNTASMSYTADRLHAPTRSTISMRTLADGRKTSTFVLSLTNSNITFFLSLLGTRRRTLIVAVCPAWVHHFGWWWPFSWHCSGLWRTPDTTPSHHDLWTAWSNPVSHSLPLFLRHGNQHAVLPLKRWTPDEKRLWQTTKKNNLWAPHSACFSAFFTPWFYQGTNDKWNVFEVTLIPSVLPTSWDYTNSKIHFDWQLFNFIWLDVIDRVWTVFEWRCCRMGL